MSRRLRVIFEEVGDLAVERFTEGGESGEADGGDMVVLDFGKVDIRNADLAGEVAKGDFAVDHEAVKIKDDLSHVIIIP